MIFHVDVNSYFATMCQQENPTLRGKPIGIVKDLGRTCIIAASVEAKTQGVKTGSNTYDAKQLCPKILLLPAAFDLYLAATKRLKDIFNALCPRVQIFSLDEAFLDMNGCETLMRQLVKTDYPDQSSLSEAFGRLIQQRIRRSLGTFVGCNVGISHNKLLAKMAGEIATKGSVFTITRENLDEVLSQISFKDVCGVGYRLEKRLLALGVTSPFQLNLLDDETLSTQFGPFWSRELRKIGRGEETHFFTHTPTVSHMQSVGRTLTGFKLTDDEDKIKRTLLNLLEEATYKVRQMNLAGRGLAIFLAGHERSWGRRVRLKYYVRHTNEIFALLYERFYKNWHREFPVIRFGVFVFDLKPMSEIPLSLLPSFQKNERLYDTIDQVNNRFGLFSLRPATLMGRDIIRPEVTGFLGDKIFHGF